VNVLGAELLMPESAVREGWATLSDLTKVAARSEVSVLAAQWRLYSFGLAKQPA
jgi:Zn-dependent peptidase ImmA (M78 family)